MRSHITPKGYIFHADNGCRCVCHTRQPYEWPCPCGREALEQVGQQMESLLEIAQEIASDPKIDLVDSERRIRLYAAITKAGGKL